MENTLKYTGGGLLLGILLCAALLNPEGQTRTNATSDPIIVVTSYHFFASAGILTP